MKNLHLLASILLSIISLSALSAESNSTSSNLSLLQISSDPTDDKSIIHEINYNFTSNKISLPNVNEDWIKTEINPKPDNYSISTNKNLTFGNEISFAWNFTKFLKLNLNVFENQFQDNEFASIGNFDKLLVSTPDKSFAQDVFTNEINRSISGYKFGISSELGIGEEYKLGMNLDYGQLEGADLVGFNSEAISTTSFALGIRNSKFGASLNTDIYLEDDINMFDSSRLGFEIDWHFSDETKISVGSKQRINNSITETNNSLNGLTGNVQYIKFQHNL